MFDLRNPRSEFLRAERPPLLERNPLRFWQGLSLILASADISSAPSSIAGRKVHFLERERAFANGRATPGWRHEFSSAATRSIRERRDASWSIPMAVADHDRLGSLQSSAIERSLMISSPIIDEVERIGRDPNIAGRSLRGITRAM